MYSGVDQKEIKQAQKTSKASKHLALEVFFLTL